MSIWERLRSFTIDWNGARMVDGEPPIDGLRCKDLREAADCGAALEQRDRTCVARYERLLADYGNLKERNQELERALRDLLNATRVADAYEEHMRAEALLNPQPSAPGEPKPDDPKFGSERLCECGCRIDAPNP